MTQAERDRKAAERYAERLYWSYGGCAPLAKLKGAYLAGLRAGRRSKAKDAK